MFLLSFLGLQLFYSLVAQAVETKENKTKQSLKREGTSNEAFSVPHFQTKK